MTNSNNKDKRPKVMSMKDGEEALKNLARINGVSVEEMRAWVDKTSKKIIQAMNRTKPLTNREIINLIKEWQDLVKDWPLDFKPYISLRCQKDTSHGFLEPKEKNGKVLLVCSQCRYTRDDIPDIVLSPYEHLV